MYSDYSLGHQVVKKFRNMFLSVPLASHFLLGQHDSCILAQQPVEHSTKPFYPTPQNVDRLHLMLTFYIDHHYCRSPRCDGFSGADLGKLVLRAANYRFREFFRLR